MRVCGNEVITHFIKDYTILVILFPHTWIHEEKAKQVLSFFDAFTICLPWFMDRPSFIPEKEAPHSISIHYPPMDLKPDTSFPALLSEYRGWIRNNRDKGFRDFLKATRSFSDMENHTWEIREKLRGGGKGSGATVEDLSMKWHLLLHLAQEVEREQIDADRMLAELKRSGSPLKGMMEEEDVTNIFMDLRSFETDSLIGEEYLRPICQGWFFLFGAYLGEKDLLVTFNPHVMDSIGEYLSETSSLTVIIPDLCSNTLEGIGKAREEFYSSKKGKEIRKSVEDFLKDAKGKSPDLTGWTGDAPTPFLQGQEARVLRLTFRHFAPMKDARVQGTDDAGPFPAIKTLILLEEAPCHE